MLEFLLLIYLICVNIAVFVFAKQVYREGATVKELLWMTVFAFTPVLNLFVAYAFLEYELGWLTKIFNHQVFKGKK